jgi:hypothetical protein
MFPNVMKQKSQSGLLRSSGILRWSTLGLLVGGGATMVSCDSESTYVATQEDEKMAVLEQKLDELDRQRAQFTQGYVLHNMELPGLGFYHADAQDFFPMRYGQEQNGKWFANGEWVDVMPPPPEKSMSHPKPEALKRVEEVLAQQQEALAGQPQDPNSTPTTVHHHHGGGMGIGNMMMMYWLLTCPVPPFNARKRVSRLGNKRCNGIVRRSAATRLRILAISAWCSKVARAVVRCERGRRCAVVSALGRQEVPSARLVVEVRRFLLA